MERDFLFVIFAVQMGFVRPEEAMEAAGKCRKEDGQRPPAVNLGGLAGPLQIATDGSRVGDGGDDSHAPPALALQSVKRTCKAARGGRGRRPRPGSPRAG